MQSRESKLVQFDLYFSKYIPCCFAQLREAFKDSFFDASSMTTAIAAKRGSSKEEAIAFTDKTTEQRHQKPVLLHRSDFVWECRFEGQKEYSKQSASLTR